MGDAMPSPAHDSCTDLHGWNSPARPERVVLQGKYARLEPLNPNDHLLDLFDVAQEPGGSERYRFLLEDAPTSFGDMEHWARGATASEDPLFFAVIDRSTGRAEGRQALMRIDEKNGVIELGSILWGAKLARTRAATESFYLLAHYIFDDLGYRRLEWKCDDGNEPSKRAARRFGFTPEGVFRHHMVIKGKNRDTAWFSITADEWPGLSAALRAWLDPRNFDQAGSQVRRLEEYRP